MAGASQSMRFRAAAEPGMVRALRVDLARFLHELGLDEAMTFDIKLAVSEAANNVLQHAYREHRTPGAVAVDARTRDGRLVVTITDDGGGPAPRPDSPGAGLGMPMMATLADGIDVRRREAGGTTVELSFVTGQTGGA